MTSAFFRDQKWNIGSELAFSVQWMLLLSVIVLMLVNLKKKIDFIDLIILILLWIKFGLNLLDFEEVRFTQGLVANIYYYGLNSFSILTFQIMINTVTDLKFSFPMTIAVLIIIQFGEMRIINPGLLPIYDLFLQNQYVILTNFFQNFIALIFIWMILSFFKN